MCVYVCVCVCFREWADMEAQRDERIEMGVALAASREKAHQASKWLAEAEENLSRVKAGELHVKSNMDKKLGEAKKRIELALAEIRDRHEEDMGRFESRVDKANEVLERARENYQRELAAKEAEVAVLDGKQRQNHSILDPRPILDTWPQTWDRDPADVFIAGAGQMPRYRCFRRCIGTRRSFPTAKQQTLTPITPQLFPP